MNHFTKKLEQLSDSEWESLCDGCGKCCLHKLEDEDSKQVFFTSIACQLLDIQTCRCSDYQNRCQRVSDCINMRKGFTRYDWLPSTCAYRLVYLGDELPDWHPLISGDPETVHKAGQSVRDFAISESEDIDLRDFVIEGLN